MANVHVWSGLPYDSQSISAEVVGASWRAPSAVKTYRKLLPYLNRLNITRLADLTDLDEIGIPIVNATRPEADESQITSTQGKGSTRLEAMVSALMEAVERHCGARVVSLRRESVRTMRESREAFLGPAELSVADWPDDAAVEWVAATSFGTAKTVWIPAAEVYFPYVAPQQMFRTVCPSTTGLAAGNNCDEALLHALFEVSERHAVSRLHEGGSAFLVDLERLTDSKARPLLDRFDAAKVKVIALDLSALTVLPTYLVLTLDHCWPGPPQIIGGQGAHLHAGIALSRALAEAAQSRIVALLGSREDLHRHAKAWLPGFEETEERFELLRSHGAQGGIVGLPALPRLMSTAQAVGQLLDRLAGAGFANGVWKNLSDPNIAISVVRVCIPGLLNTIVDTSRRESAS